MTVLFKFNDILSDLPVCFYHSRVEKAVLDSGVKILFAVVACQMSMDIMDIRQEELIDGVEIGGVGSYLGDAEEANVNLFI